jgi:PAS domain S-box-containing protein
MICGRERRNARFSDLLSSGHDDQRQKTVEMETGVNNDKDIEAEVRRQETELVYRNVGVAQAVSIAIASLVVFVDASLQVAPGAAIVWWCVIAAISAGRYELGRRYWAAKRDAAETPIWRFRYVIGTALIAATWGIGTMVLLWHAQDRAVLFTALVLAGMVAGAVPILTPVPLAFNTFVLLVCLPLSTQILLQANTAMHLAFGLMCLVFLAAMLVSSRYLHKKFEAAIRLGLEKTRLAGVLAESEDRYRIVSGLSSDFIFSCSRQEEEYFHIDWMAGSCELIFGISARELKEPDLWRCIVGDGLVTFDRYTKALVPEASSECELVVTQADGSTRYVRAITKVLQPKADEVTYRMYGAFQDITERKLAEKRVEMRTQELSRSNDELKLTLERLQQTQRQLVESEKMAALGGLVAGIAHEINTPVGIGVTAASVLEDETRQLAGLYRQGQMKKADLEQYMSVTERSSQMILNNLERAAELIRSFKQVAVDQSSENKRRINVKSYLEEILTSLRPSLRKARASCTVDCVEDLEIESYPGVLSQIITNLVINALTHAFDGEQNGVISIMVKKPGDRLEIEFSDNGKGMSPEVLARIFDPFFTTRRGEGGSGLGLHIVYNLVTQTLKGGITAHSQPGRGTSFAIQWPLG